jgi:hypothetical protein
VGEPVTVYVRMNASNLGTTSGNIVLTTNDATQKDIAVSGIKTGTFYSKSTGNLNVLANWGSNTDGTGTAPISFSENGSVYEIRNRATATIDANWAVSGSASKVVVGDGTNAVDFTIPADFALSGTVDVANSGKLTIENTTLPTIGLLSNGSNIEYKNIAIDLATSFTYHHLKISGTGTKNFPAGTVTINGNLIIENTTINGATTNPFSTILLRGNLTYVGTVIPPADANSITISTNGTALGTQIFDGAGNIMRWFRIQSNTANTIQINNADKLLLGNNSGGGVTLVDGSILNMNGNDFQLFNNAGTSSAFLLNTTGSISVSAATDFIIERTGNGNLGTLRFTNGANTMDSFTYNHTGSSNRSTRPAGSSAPRAGTR